MRSLAHGRHDRCPDRGAISCFNRSRSAVRISSLNDNPYQDRISLSPAVSISERGIAGKAKSTRQLVAAEEIDISLPGSKESPCRSHYRCSD